MPRRGAQPSTSTVHDLTYGQNRAEIAIGEIERTIRENQDRPLSGVLKGVTEQVRWLTNAEGALMGVCGAWGVVCRASVGRAPDVGSKLQSGPTLTSKCIESGRVVICEETDEVYQAAPQPTRWRLRSVVVVPILGQDSVVGVVEVLSSRAAAFSMQHVAELQHIAQLLAPILPREEPAQSELPEEKRHLSMTVAGAVFLLGLLLLRLEFQYRPSKLSPAATYPSARAAANPTEVPTNSEGAARHEAEPAQSFTASDQSEVEAPPTALSPSPLLHPMAHRLRPPANHQEGRVRAQPLVQQPA